MAKYSRIAERLLQGHRGRYKGVTRRFIFQLGNLGWSYVGDKCFEDGWGRRFHLVNTPWSHALAILQHTWMDRVVSQVCHRKGLAELETIDVMALRPWRGLSAAAAGLVRQSVAGVHFTGDTKHHFSDSREHRFLTCVGTADLRLQWGIDKNLRTFP